MPSPTRTSIKLGKAQTAAASRDHRPHGRAADVRVARDPRPRRDPAPAARVPGRSTVVVSDLWPSAVDTGELPADDAPVVDPTPVGGVPIARVPRRWRRRVVWSLVATFVAGSMYYAITLYQVHTTGQSDHAGPADAIVVMGAAQYDGTPSPLLQARLDHALLLWGQGYAPRDGGHRRQSTRRPVHRGRAHRRRTWSSAGCRWTRSSRRPRGRARSTRSRPSPSCWRTEGCCESSWSAIPFHSLRIKLTAEELGLDAEVSPTRTSPVQGSEAWRREMKEAAGVALGRIIGFRRLLDLTG